MVLTRLLFSLAVAVVVLPAANAQLMGADEVLRKVASSQPAAPERGGSPMRKEIEDLRARIITMPPSQAAKAWLAMYQKVGQMPPGPDMGEAITYVDVFGALPGPGAWGELNKQIRQAHPAGKRSEVDEALVLAGAILVGDKKEVVAGAARLRKKVGPTAELGSTSEGLAASIAAWTGDSIGSLQALRTAMASKTPQEVLPQIPDLVRSMGEAKSRTILKEILMGAKAPFGGVEGAATGELARKVALENIAKLKAPQWVLAVDDSPSAVALFEALTKRFPAKAKAEGRRNFGESIRQGATLSYVKYLLRKGQPEAAAKLSDGALLSSLRYGQTETEFADIPVDSLFRFLHLTIGSGGTNAPWDLYGSSAYAANKSDLAEAAMRKRLANPKLAVEERSNLSEALFRLLVAQEKIDAALNALDGDRTRKAEKLIALGSALNRKDLADQGVRLLLETTPENVAPRGRRYDYYFGTGMAGDEITADLIRQGRFADAERIVTQRLIDGLKPPAPSISQTASNISSEMPALLAIYSAAGRPQDVLKLLEDSPYWPAPDLAMLLNYPSPGGASVGFLAAKALADVGRKAEAERIVVALLNRERNYDPAYDLFLELKGADALPVLDTMFLQDQFEERPLIFKAVQLLRMKRIPEAEQTIRKAISIDPSDGEQLYGTRMRGYSVLADVLDAKGDAEQAKVFRGAVSAIRLSEKADELNEVGLTKDAIALYKRSLQLFSDAYCIQSRLAIQLAQLGRHEEAAEHYRRAYELMPESFGRVESHCFGCEGAFASGQAQNIAESVFQDLLKKMPSKPQVRYLLGYLRDIQDRPSEALAYYRQAVKLDPDYLNAWKSINEKDDLLTLGERKEVVFQLLRLDPLQKHAQADIKSISDLKALWVELDKALKKLPPLPPTSLMPLRASALKLKDRMDSMMMMDLATDPGEYASVWRFGSFGSLTRATSPAQPLATHTVLKDVVAIMDSVRQREMYGGGM